MTAHRLANTILHVALMNTALTFEPSESGETLNVTLVRVCEPGTDIGHSDGSGREHLNREFKMLAPVLIQARETDELDLYRVDTDELADAIEGLHKAINQRVQIVTRMDKE